jgi:hypothetical protein
VSEHQIKLKEVFWNKAIALFAASQAAQMGVQTAF